MLLEQLQQSMKNLRTIIALPAARHRNAELSEALTEFRICAFMYARTVRKEVKPVFAMAVTEKPLYLCCFKSQPARQYCHDNHLNLTAEETDFLKLLDELDYYVQHTGLKNKLLDDFSFSIEFTETSEGRLISKTKLEQSKAWFDNFAMITMQCVVNHKKRQLAARGINWDVEATEEIGKPLNELLTCDLQFGTHRRKQIISVILQHYFCIDVEVWQSDNGKKLKVAVFDAAKHSKTTGFIASLRKFPVISHLHVMADAQQSDKITCPFFALDYAKQLRKVDGLFALLEKHSDKEGNFSAEILPPRLCKNTQFFPLLEKLPNQDVPFNKKGESLRQYVSRHGGFFSGEQPSVRRNFATLDKTQSICSEMLATIESLAADEVVALSKGVASGNGFRTQT